MFLYHPRVPVPLCYSDLCLVWNQILSDILSEFVLSQMYTFIKLYFCRRRLVGFYLLPTTFFLFGGQFYTCDPHSDQINIITPT